MVPTLPTRRLALGMGWQMAAYNKYIYSSGTVWPNLRPGPLRACVVVLFSRAHRLAGSSSPSSQTTPTSMAAARATAAADSRGAQQHLWEDRPAPDWDTTFPPPGAPVRMRVVDIATYKHPAVGAKAANKVLKQLRAQNTWLETSLRPLC
jgi:hypothetical protein